MDAAFTTEAEQRRAACDLSETNNARERVDRKAQNLGTVQAGHNGFTLLVEVDALGGDIERVQEFFHGSEDSI